MKVITFASIKGGVGKSVSSILFAEILSLKKKVLLIDIDSQASCTSYYSPPNESHYFNTYDVLTGKHLTKKAIKKINGTLDFLPSHISLSKFNDSKGIGHELKLKMALKGLDYDYILLDTPPSVSSELINALVVTNYLIVPLTAEVWSIESLAILEDKMKEVKNIYNPGFEKTYMIQTMFEENRKVPADYYNDLKKVYKNTFIDVKIHRSSAIQKMVTFREKPKPSERYYKEYNKIIEAIL